MKAVLFLLSATLCSYVSAAVFPLFKQCDAAWASNYLGYAGNRSVCQSGCLISSISMVLNQYKIKLNVSDEMVAANPGTINSWMKNNEGFEDGYGFKWNCTVPLGLVWTKFSQDPNELFEAFDNGKIIILHVRNNNHYVLMNGYS